MEGDGAGRVPGQGLALHAVGEAPCAGHLHTVQCPSCCGCSGEFAALGTLLLTPTPAGHAGPPRRPCLPPQRARAEGGDAQPRVTCSLRKELPAQAAAALPCRRCWEQVGSQHVPGCAAAVAPPPALVLWVLAGTGNPSLELKWDSSGAYQDLTCDSHRDCVSAPGAQAAPGHGWTLLVARTAHSGPGSCWVCAEGPAGRGRAVNRPACLHKCRRGHGGGQGARDVRAWRGGVWGGGPCPAPC